MVEGVTRSYPGPEPGSRHTTTASLQANEVLLDSEQWPGGEAVVADSQAPVSEERVAVRIFGLLVPDNNAVAFQ